MISECRFDSCMKAAIGGAANFMCPVVIDHCQFYHNSQANGNIPQLNLTASSDVSIVDCTLEGDSTKYMSGGIAVANWYGVDGLTTTIANCEVRNSRYGLTTMGVMDVYITDNQLINNRYEQNPMNGGSAISLYDPYYKQKVYISGNRLEKKRFRRQSVRPLQQQRKHRLGPGQHLECGHARQYQHRRRDIP